MPIWKILDFDLSEVKEVKMWTSISQNEKPTPFLDFLTQKTYISIPIKPTQYSLFYFDLSEVNEVKRWPPGGQNKNLMPFLNSLTPKTYVLLYMKKKSKI